MTRLIDVDKIVFYTPRQSDGDGLFVKWLKEILKNAPTVDAVPVIRCKNCEWHKEKRCTVWRERAVIVECYTDDFGYCYLAKEKENEQTKV